MNRLPLAWLLAALVCAPALAQNPDDGSFHVHMTQTQAADAQLSKVMGTAQELEQLTGYRFTSDKSEVRPTLVRNAAKITTGSDAEVRAYIVTPCLSFYSMIDPQKALSAEETFWQNRGYGFTNDTRKQAQQALQQAQADAATPSSGQQGYLQASQILANQAVLPARMNLYLAAQRAYAESRQVSQLYSNGQKDSADFQTEVGMRNADLGALGFRNLDKAVMPGTAMTAPQLVPAEGGWLQRNADMFTGLVAPLVWDGASKGLLTSAPSPDELKKAANNDDARWGFSMLDQFQSGNNVAFLQGLAGQMGQ